MSSSRELILGRVRTALSALPRRAPLPDWEDELVALRRATAEADLQSLFTERLKAVNGTVLNNVGELAALLAAKDWRHGYCDPAVWAWLRTAMPRDFAVETEFDRRRIDDYQFGVTAASGAIAETGTLILSDRDTPSRLAALAPWAHIVVVRRAQIMPDLAAAVAALGDDPNVVWVTGPSKTADVEGILIEGVHGPGVQAALLIE
ncbi:MAG: LutC/YkgG family protein [Opitutaceae bacterium]